ncbi:DUF1501 domain-containing protein [Tahibacter amnicola]|uniref:DUF1501 domain-containing protein n=1 Tax=Tahibacter amnicola TaxID=2976241 RepID=A0ABY6BJ65_9GAMM|nr:DUF1501 domain-containing protein [Tahibacter amnicola]UXI70053.1 DUF1501 domain-containing protein [Tahibacter amnicola]
MTVNRREFLRRCIHSAIGGASIYSAFGGLRLIESAAAAQLGSFPDYRALVCIFLYGGNDSFNMIVPSDPPHYSTYQATRRGLAIDRERLRALSPLNDGLPGDGAHYGLHENMPELADLFNAGHAAVIANVGTLQYPITAAQYQAGTVPSPLQLFSHGEQTTFWQTSRVDDVKANGWGGRIADLLHPGNPNQQLTMSISLFGDNQFQRGDNVPQYVMSHQGVKPLEYEERESATANAVFNALATEAPQHHVFERAFTNAMRRSMSNYALINSGLQAATDFPAFPTSELGLQLKMVARLISARNTLNMRRQVFFVALPGLDHHNGQLTAHAPILEDLSRSLKAFYDATVAMGVQNSVTAYTTSEFGRSTSINGDGTDHGWGGHHFVVGGAVRGRRFYGRMPSLASTNNPDDTGYGQIIPTLAVDQYAATIARWFGVNNSGISDIFPNLGRFATADLGFLS